VDSGIDQDDFNARWYSLTAGLTKMASFKSLLDLVSAWVIRPVA